MTRQGHILTASLLAAWATIVAGCNEVKYKSDQPQERVDHKLAGEGSKPETPPEPFKPAPVVDPAKATPDFTLTAEQYHKAVHDEDGEASPDMLKKFTGKVVELTGVLALIDKERRCLHLMRGNFELKPGQQGYSSNVWCMMQSEAAEWRKMTPGQVVRLRGMVQEPKPIVLGQGIKGVVQSDGRLLNCVVIKVDGPSSSLTAGQLAKRYSENPEGTATTLSDHWKRAVVVTGEVIEKEGGNAFYLQTDQPTRILCGFEQDDRTAQDIRRLKVGSKVRVMGLFWPGRQSPTEARLIRCLFWQEESRKE